MAQRRMQPACVSADGVCNILTEFMPELVVEHLRENHGEVFRVAFKQNGRPQEVRMLSLFLYLIC